MRSRILILLCSASIIVMAGCTDTSNSSISTNNISSAVSASNKFTGELEVDVAAYIKDIWPGAEVTVTVEPNGRVTLEGTVGSEVEKDEMDAEIELLPGVDRVRNRIEVQ